jgi:hypothetical protein
MLENQVNNWTLHDNALRGAVDVGAAYGANTRDVAHILTKIAEEHGRVPECLVFDWLIRADFRHDVIANSNNHVLLSATLIDIMRNVDLRYVTPIVDCLDSLECSVSIPTFFQQSIDRITRFYNLTFTTEAIS